jgi:uncharacterized protein (TIGR02145 family)
VDSDGDGIFDSQDDCVGIDDACGVCNGNGVDADTDGICDDVDPCVGALDECGVCNGPGPSIPVIEEIVYVTDSLFLPPTGTWYVFSFAVDTLFSYVCPVQGCTDTQASNFNPLAVIEDGSCFYGPAQCGGQSTVTFDGHTYNLVGIGTQCWFKENLRSDNYRNGDAIPGNLSNSSWQNTTTGAQAIHSSIVLNSAVHGRLYNWFAVNDVRGLCPTGFHVPSDAEWTTLTNFLGGVGIAGGKMKSKGTKYWRSPNEACNESGFSGLPGGSHNYFGGFNDIGSDGYWWSATENDADYAWSRSLYYRRGNVYGPYNYKMNGFSVRCLRD